MRTATDWTVIGVYVDDMVVASTSAKALQRTKDKLKERFPMTEQGPIHSIVGIDVVRNRAERTITLSQVRMIEQIEERWDLPGDFKRSVPSVPLPSKLLEAADADGSPKLSADEASTYCSIVGLVTYIAAVTRPDLSFAASFLARHMISATQAHLALAWNTVSFMHATRQSRCLRLGGRFSDMPPLRVYTDAAFADGRTTTEGAICFLGAGNAILWQSHKQPVTATSTACAESLALASGLAMARRISLLLSDFFHDAYLRRATVVPVLLTDNKSAYNIRLNGDINYSLHPAQLARLYDLQNASSGMTGGLRPQAQRGRYRLGGHRAAAGRSDDEATCRSCVRLDVELPGSYGGSSPVSKASWR